MDVGFSDSKFYIKTLITDGEKPERFQLEFLLCQAGRDKNAECLRLSSCAYGGLEVDAAVAVLKELP